MQLITSVNKPALGGGDCSVLRAWTGLLNGDNNACINGTQRQQAHTHTHTHTHGADKQLAAVIPPTNQHVQPPLAMYRQCLAQVS